MKLETEFRICLQRQMLEWALRDSSPDSPIEASQNTQPQPEFEPSTWVELLVPPRPFSFNQALLLCPCSDQEWLAWVPDYGEIMLNTSDFRPLSEEF